MPSFNDAAPLLVDGLYYAARAAGAGEAAARASVATVLDRARDRFPSDGPDGSFKVWLLMALRQEARAGGWEFPALPAAAPDDDAPAPVDPAAIDAPTLRDAAASLPPLQRLLLVLCDREGLGYREVAAVLKGSPEDAAAALRSARRELRRCLAT